MEIYWASGSPNAWRVLLGAAIKGLDYESRLLEFSKGDLKTPEFRALNPRGKVPVVRDEGFVLYESMAILDYFEQKEQEPRLFGRTAREAALIRRIASEFDCYLREPLSKVVGAVLRRVGAAPERAALTPEVLNEASIVVPDELKSLERIAADGPWLAGERPSAADASIYPFVRLLVRAGSKAEGLARELGVFPFSEIYPELNRWIAAVEGLPGYDETYPPHWRASA